VNVEVEVSSAAVTDLIGGGVPSAKRLKQKSAPLGTRVERALRPAYY
jgi:hypothetical protein